MDAILSHILEIFPAFGRRMIAGHLRYMGHQVPRARIRESYERVTGTPAYLTSQCVERRVYHVAGPNSLWHHDGQHSMFSQYQMSNCLIYSLFTQVSFAGESLFMHLLMAFLDWLQLFKLMTTIVQRLYLHYFLKPLQNMGHPAGYEVIMVLKILVLLGIWKKIMV